jgi:hypothetical protein
MVPAHHYLYDENCGREVFLGRSKVFRRSAHRAASTVAHGAGCDQSATCTPTI